MFFTREVTAEKVSSLLSGNCAIPVILGGYCQFLSQDSKPTIAQEGSPTANLDTYESGGFRRLQLTGSNNLKYAQYVFLSAVDVTNYSKLKVDWAMDKGDVSTSFCTFGVSPSKTLPVAVNSAISGSANYFQGFYDTQYYPRAVNTVDISSLSGNCYVFFGVATYDTAGDPNESHIDIYNVWLVV